MEKNNINFPPITHDDYKHLSNKFTPMRLCDEFYFLYNLQGENLLKETSSRSVSKTNPTKMLWSVIRDKQIKILLARYEKNRDEDSYNALLKWAYKPDKLPAIEDNIKEVEEKVEKKNKKDELLEPIMKGIERIESTLKETDED